MTLRLKNPDFVIPVDATDQEARNARTRMALRDIQTNLVRMWQVDDATFANLKTKHPELEIDGAWPPMALDRASSEFNSAMEMLNNWLQFEVKSWASSFKMNAENFLRAGDQASANQQLERIKAIDPLVVQVSEFYQKTYPLRYQQMLDEYTNQKQKYEQASLLRESAKLTEQADRARALAETVLEESKKAEELNKPVEAKILVEKAQELNQKAEQLTQKAEAKETLSYVKEKYQEALKDQEAKKLLAEAEQTRELASKVMEESKKAQAHNNPAEAIYLVQKAEQLTQKAEAKEALAEIKMPKSKTGIALALAAAAALILASQE